MAAVAAEAPVGGNKHVPTSTSTAAPTRHGEREGSFVPSDVVGYEHFEQTNGAWLPKDDPVETHPAASKEGIFALPQKGEESVDMVFFVDAEAAEKGVGGTRPVTLGGDAQGTAVPSGNGQEQDVATGVMNSDFSEAFREDGEIDWDCPCMKPIMDSPCKDQFKSSFLCFLRSTEEPQGADCGEQFKSFAACVNENEEYFNQKADEAMQAKDKRDAAAAEAAAATPVTKSE